MQKSAEHSDEVPPGKERDAKIIFDEFVCGITLDESNDEIRSVAMIVLEKILGLTSTDVMKGRPMVITEGLSASLASALERINNGEPVQYVVEEAFFYGRTYAVGPAVLIPRPETEELIRAVLACKFPSQTPGRRVLDIATGSGCIAVTLSLELKGAEVLATDISADALAIARKNAQKHKADITFFHHDIFSGSLPAGQLDIIVSNPPYVTHREADQMQRNVKDFEPHLALFVPGDDPLLFYRAIIERAVGVLKTDGLLAVEINENYGAEVADLFTSARFNDVRVIRDVPGKPRVVCGRKL